LRFETFATLAANSQTELATRKASKNSHQTRKSHSNSTHGPNHFVIRAATPPSAHHGSRPSELRKAYSMSSTPAESLTPRDAHHCSTSPHPIFSIANPSQRRTDVHMWMEVKQNLLCTSGDCFTNIRYVKSQPRVSWYTPRLPPSSLVAPPSRSPSTPARTSPYLFPAVLTRRTTSPLGARGRRAS